jgi:hypothetical protein
MTAAEEYSLPLMAQAAQAAREALPRHGRACGNESALHFIARQRLLNYGHGKLSVIFVNDLELHRAHRFA